MHTALRSAAVIVVAIAGCNDKSSKPLPASTPAPTTKPAPAAQAQPSSTPTRSTSPPGRDLTTLNACALVTHAEVAKLAGATVAATSRATGPACIYALDRDGHTVLYKLAFYEAQPVEAMFAAETPAERGDKIDGPWTEGYMHAGFAPGDLVFSAYWRGDLAMDVMGDRKEPTLALARLAASRIPPR